jgi:hypothetical protein
MGVVKGEKAAPSAEAPAEDLKKRLKQPSSNKVQNTG